MIVPPDVDRTTEWCKNFVWALGQITDQPVHGDPMLNDILPRLAGMNYLMLIDTISGYHNLKLSDKSSYLTKFSCPFGRY